MCASCCQFENGLCVLSSCVFVSLVQKWSVYPLFLCFCVFGTKMLCVCFAFCFYVFLKKMWMLFCLVFLCFCVFSPQYVHIFVFFAKRSFLYRGGSGFQNWQFGATWGGTVVKNRENWDDVLYGLSLRVSSYTRFANMKCGMGILFDPTLFIWTLVQEPRKQQSSNALHF